MTDFELALGAHPSPDPSLALQAPNLPAPPDSERPLYKVQYVVELVGKRSEKAPVMERILDDDWTQALGRPLVYVMTPLEDRWRTFRRGIAPTVDSLCLCWPVLGQSGRLTQASAQKLLDQAQTFANPLARRAMPLPPPMDIDSCASKLGELVECLDIGFGLCAQAPTQVPEREIWRAMADLGLTFEPDGAFRWIVGGRRLIEVTPLDSDAFSAQAAAAGSTQQGISVGFNMPHCAAPLESLAACFRVAQLVAQRIGGSVLDGDGNPVGAGYEQEMTSNMRQALDSFQRAGLPPGSAEAFTLFPSEP